MSNMEYLLERRQMIIDSLTQARKERNMTQQDLADAIGTKKSNISRIESGGQNISLDMLIRIIDALGKDLNFVIEEKKYIHPEEERMYSLCIYDDVLLKFGIHEDPLSGLQAVIYDVDEEKTGLLPLDMELTGSGLIRWLSNRVIPKNRTFVGEILRSLGLSVHDTWGIIEVCRGLSLNDSYWIVPEGFEGSYAGYNLYENRFSEILSLIAYTGQGSSDRPFSTSPELTTGGMLPKAWRYMEGKGIYLYKGGTSGGANTGREPFSEYYAAQVAECMGIRHVEYELENWKGILASKCRMFTDIDTSYVPIGRIVREGGLRACLEYYENIGEEAYEEISSMIVFDAVIYNEDRHFGNFGILRDNRTGKVTGAAPVFDNGMSLFNMAMSDDFKELENYAQTRSNPYGVSYEKICREIMGPVQRRQLRKLIGFRFRRHKSINLPEEHLAAIEEQIQRRVRELLAL